MTIIDLATISFAPTGGGKDPVLETVDYWLTDPDQQSHIVTPDAGYDGIAQISITAVLSERTAEASNLDQNIIPEGDEYGIRSVAVSGYDVDAVYDALVAING